jgi:lipopolysaccharide export system protein LptC
VVLPAFGVAMLLLVAGWTRIEPLLDKVRLGMPAIDLREARELRMVNPRYAGIDRLNRPYVVTASVGRQVPNQDDLMALEEPRADMTMHSGAWVVLTGQTGIYQSQPQLLDLFDEVNLYHENGTHFLTKSARLDLATNAAQGNEPVEGHGPSGDIAAEGFRILNKGDTVIFTGNAHLVLRGSKQVAAHSEPAALPPDVATMAGEVAAAASATAIAAAQDAAKPAKPATPAAARASARNHAGTRAPSRHDNSRHAANHAAAPKAGGHAH